MRARTASAMLSLWLPVLAWAALIFTLSSIPHLTSGLSFDFVLRKMAHFTEYFILAALLFRAFKGTFELAPALLFVYPFAATVLYAASDEFHQRFVAGRHGCVQDVLIDSSGALAFLAALALFRAFRGTTAAKTGA